MAFPVSAVNATGFAMNTGQVIDVVVCASAAPGVGAGQQAGPLPGICPTGQDAYLVEAYLPFSTSASALDAGLGPIDLAEAAGFFWLGLSLVVLFWVMGLGGSVLLRPFWASRF